MPRLEYSDRFAADLARIVSDRLERRIYENLDNIEQFGEFGSSFVPPSIAEEFGEGVRRVAVNPFDLIYTYHPEKDTARIEALVHQKTVR